MPLIEGEKSAVILMIAGKKGHFLEAAVSAAVHSKTIESLFALLSVDMFC